VEALRRYVMSAGKLHADDTPVPVLAQGKGNTKTGRLWTYVRDDRPAGDTTAPAVWFAYSPDRKGEHPERHLQNFSGILQADAYAGFNQLYHDGQIQQASCWAHVRRHFYDLEQAHASAVAREALVRISARTQESRDQCLNDCDSYCLRRDHFAERVLPIGLGRKVRERSKMVTSTHMFAWQVQGELVPKCPLGDDVML